MNMNKLLGALVALVLVTLPGCATMIRGTEETLMIVSEHSGALVEVSSGQKGTTPCHFRLKRNQSVLLKISLKGYHTKSVTVYPTLAGGGVILGGIIDYVG